MGINPDKQRQLVKKLFNNSSVRLIPAHVVSDEGETCTVRPVGADLTLPGALHFTAATPDLCVNILPVIGSLVLIMSSDGSAKPDSLMVAVVTQPQQASLLAGPVVAVANSSVLQLASATGGLYLTPDLLASLPFIPSEPQ